MRVAIISDLHLDESGAWDVGDLMRRVRWEEPDILVCLGDLVGAGSWSRHPRTGIECPDRTKSALYLFFEAVRESMPRSAGLYWCMGNHENRVDRAHVDAGAGLPAWGLGLEGLVDKRFLDRWHVRRYTDAPLEIMEGSRKLIFFHGDDNKGHLPTLRRFGYRGHVFQGHNHTLSAHFDGGCWSVRCGHLGPLRPEYIKGPPPGNWQRGFVVYEKNSVMLKALF